MSPSVDVVIPTIGRTSLAPLVANLADFPGRVIVVDDRRGDEAQLRLAPHAEMLRGSGRGPASARNVGWRASSADWVAFLDDDVRLPAEWIGDLAADLADVPSCVGASQGRVVVPLPPGRRPTDWERSVAALETSQWITADLAYRRSVLAGVGGFDERFPRAFREDADLGLRVTAAGWEIERGRRWVEHPVRPAPWWISVRAQAGNADDVLMRALHGRDWYRRAGTGPGRRRRHLGITAAGVGALAAAVARRPATAALLAGAWAAGTGEFAWQRITAGPRSPREVAAMTATSAMIPFAASAWWLKGWWDLADRLRQPGPTPANVRRPAPAAVVFDRDGTLVVDVPYNGDPALVTLMPGAKEAIGRLRAEGIPTAVVTNQSGVGRGLLTLDEVEAVNRRVVELLGPLGPWLVCPHAPGDRCACRKPSPALIRRAAQLLGVRTADVAVIGDIAADVDAAQAAGAVGILVPTPRTCPEDRQRAPMVAGSLSEAVDVLLRGAA